MLREMSYAMPVGFFPLVGCFWSGTLTPASSVLQMTTLLHRERRVSRSLAALLVVQLLIMYNITVCVTSPGRMLENWLIGLKLTPASYSLSTMHSHVKMCLQNLVTRIVCPPSCLHTQPVHMGKMCESVWVNTKHVRHLDRWNLCTTEAFR